MHRKLAPLVAVSTLSLCSLARAEQFVLVDVSYTHSAETTKDSHYYPKLAADTPKDWTKPVDYSKGSVHIILDVKTKPAGDAATKFQICFEGTPSYGCTTQSPPYTKTGRVEWDSPFAGFWYESTVDWAQGVKQMPLILKDTMNNKPAGDPKYMPTDLHVQVTLVSPGAKFVPPAAAGSGGAGASGAGAGGAGAGGAAGVAGTGAGGAGAGGAGTGAVAGAGGSPAAGSGGSAGRSAAGSGGSAGSTPSKPAPAGASASAGSPSSGTSSPSAGSGTTTGAQTAAGSGDDVTEDSDSGCRSAGSGSHGAWSLGLLLAYVATRRRRPN